MIRTRFVWFTGGFAATAAAVSHFAWGDHLADRLALSSRVIQEFGALEARRAKLESPPARSSDAAPQVEG